MDINTLNNIDIIVIIMLVGSGFLAALRGFIRETLGLAGWFLAFLLAGFLTSTVADLFTVFLKDAETTQVIAWLSTFIAFVILFYVLSNVISPLVKQLTIGILDRPLGFLFGVLRGIVIISVVYMAALLLLKDERLLSESVRASNSILPIRLTASVLTKFAPEDLQFTLNEVIPEQDTDILFGRIKKPIEDNTLLPDEVTVPLPENNN